MGIGLRAYGLQGLGWGLPYVFGLGFCILASSSWCLLGELGK